MVFEISGLLILRIEQNWIKDRIKSATTGLSRIDFYRTFTRTTLYRYMLMYGTHFTQPREVRRGNLRAPVGCWLTTNWSLTMHM